jgi:hypothetical protein
VDVWFTFVRGRRDPRNKFDFENLWVFTIKIGFISWMDSNLIWNFCLLLWFFLVIYCSILSYMNVSKHIQYYFAFNSLLTKINLPNPFIENQCLLLHNQTYTIILLFSLFLLYMSIQQSYDESLSYSWNCRIC